MIKYNSQFIILNFMHIIKEKEEIIMYTIVDFTFNIQYNELNYGGFINE